MDSPTGPAKAPEIRMQDIRAAVAKAAELRALHAALLQGGATSGIPAAVGFDAGSSPSVSRSTDHFAVPEDYPVFAPTYEDDSLPGYQYHRRDYGGLSQTWSAIGLEGRGNEAIYFYDNCLKKLSTSNGALYVPSLAEHLSNKTSRINRMPLLEAAKEYGNLMPSSRIESGEYRPATRHPTYDTGKQGRVVNLEVSGDGKNLKNVVASCNLEQSAKMHSKNKGQIFSWLFPKSRKKTKPEMSPKVAESEDMSQLLKECRVLSLESLKNELTEANENRDAAHLQASETRSSLVELQQKLANLELYCQELKKALKQTMQVKSSHGPDRSNLLTRMNFASGQEECLIPVSVEVMVEGFLQLAYEARLSVKQFCKKLLKQMEENDDLADKINNLLQSCQISWNSKYSKGVIYHLEALVNQSLYQDFDNCVFRTNGSPNFLDPRHERRENFSSFVALRNLSWNEVLQKGTKHYSDDFCKFCDQKMSCIVSLLNWSTPWPEELLQYFFIAAKCIWLLHSLAFSFNPPVTILRVSEDRVFDPIYMEDIPLGRHKAPAPAPVKIMVTPGFYIQDSVLKCRVLCKRTLK